jgi:hypothetical protein
MPYDFQRGAKIGAAAAGVAYFGSALVDKVVTSSPVALDDKTKPVVTAAVAAIAADAFVQLVL